MQGYIYSTDRYGTSPTGSGFQFIVYLQGCSLRCDFCPIPQIWKLNRGRLMETSELLKEYQENRSYYTTGGLTAAGGETLLQLDFLIELFTKAKELNISTCLETTGYSFSTTDKHTVGKFEKLMNVTDFVFLNLKHINPKEHLYLTKIPIDATLKFARFLESQKKPMGIRYPLIPRLTIKDSWLEELGLYAGSLENVKTLELSPYFSGDIRIYDELNLPRKIPLPPSISPEELKQYENIVLDKIKYMRKI